jgi:hypothetical protein
MVDHALHHLRRYHLLNREKKTPPTTAATTTIKARNEIQKVHPTKRTIPTINPIVPTNTSITTLDKHQNAHKII